MATDRLAPGQLAFHYGALLPSPTLTTTSGNMASIKIITQKDAAGKYTSVKFTIEFDIDPKCVKAYNAPNRDPSDPGYYVVNYNEIGFSENSELLDTGSDTRIFANFVGTTPVITSEIPLANVVKKDSESLGLFEIIAKKS